MTIGKNCANIKADISESGEQPARFAASVQKQRTSHGWSRNRFRQWQEAMGRHVLIAVISVVICWGSSVQAQNNILRKVRFVPQWIPQAQFAGYYVAHEKGFYNRQGIDVTIVRGGPASPPSRLLKDGAADFGTMFLATAIEKRANGIELVNIGQIVQRSSLMLVAKKSRGIFTPQDINGKKVGLWGPEFQAQAKAFFRKFNLSVTDVRQSTTVNLFLRDGVDVASAMWYNEYHTIINSGLDPDELTTFFLFDYGLNFPEDGIYCLKKTYEEDPRLCCRFLDATLEGWRYAFDHPREALDIVMKYVNAANIATNRIHQKWMLARMKDIICPAGNTMLDPKLKPDDYMRVAKGLRRNGLLNKIPAYSDFFIDCKAHVQE